MSPRLSPQEIAYLLGKPENGQNEQGVPTVAIQTLELLERLLPMRFTSYVVLFVVLTIMPMLGFRVMQNLIGPDGSFVVGTLTALVGVFLIYRNANTFLRQAVEKVRNAEIIPVEVLQRGATCIAGVLLMLPGPVVNLLALGILCPPVTRLIALSVYRYLQRPKA
jgi:Protein affecting phage T7 exclusion by the F plasmid